MYRHDAFAVAVGRTLLRAALSGSIVANGMAAEPGYGPVFRHAALEYMSSREFPRVELEVGGSIAVQSVRLCFRAQQHRDFYYVEMNRKDKSDRFVALLPMPLVETAQVVYYFVVVDTALRQFVSAQFQSRVTAAALAGSISGNSPMLRVQPVRPGSMARLQGFRPDGVVGAPTVGPTPAPSPTPATRSAGSKERAPGSGGHGLLLGAVGAAAAGFLGVVASKGDPKPTSTPGPLPTPTTVTPIALTPKPVPTPTPTPSPFLKYYGTYRVLLILAVRSHCAPTSFEEAMVLEGGKAGAWFQLSVASQPGHVCSGTVQRNGQFQCGFPNGVTVTGHSDGAAITGQLHRPGPAGGCTWNISGPKVGD